MGYQQNKQRKTLNAYGEQQAELTEYKQEQEMEQKSENFEIKIKQLANKTVDCILNQQPGQEFLPEMMMNFLEMALMMESVIETMKAVTLSMGCVSEALGFIDDAINYNQNIFTGSMVQKYGFFERLRRKSQQRKAIRNTENRMKAAVSSISATFEMSQEMVESMSTMSFRITNMMNQTKRRRAKKKAAFDKKNPDARTTGYGSAAQNLVNSILAERGIDSASVPTKPVDAPAPEKKSGAGDIGDIL